LARRRNLKTSASAGRRRRDLDAESTTTAALGCRRHGHPSAPLLRLPCIAALVARSGSGWGSPSTGVVLHEISIKFPASCRPWAPLSSWHPSSCRPWDAALFSLSDVLRARCYIHGPYVDIRCYNGRTSRLQGVRLRYYKFQC
jgi:hypothetical protein